MTGEQRIHARLEIEAECLVIADSGTEECRIRDLSNSGALIRGSKELAQMGESITVELELPGVETPIGVLGEVVRIIPEGDKHLYGLRFALVEPRQRDDLTQFIASMLREDPSDNKGPKIYRRVPVVCKTPQQSRGLIQDIFKGVLAVDSKVPVVVNEEITLEISASGSKAPLELPGFVSHVRSLENGHYHVGVHLGELSDDGNQAVESFIQDMLTTAAEDPE